MTNAPQPQVKRKSTTELEREFRELASQWRLDTGHFSIVSQMTRHPAYQSIIEMGEPAIPLILKDLLEKPDHWFPALAAISGESPQIPKEDRRQNEGHNQNLDRVGQVEGLY